MQLVLVCDVTGRNTETLPMFNITGVTQYLYYNRNANDKRPNVLTNINESNILSTLRTTVAADITHAFFIQQGVEITTSIDLPSMLAATAYRVNTYRDGYFFREVAILDISVDRTCYSLNYNLWSDTESALLLAQGCLTYPHYSNHGASLTRLHEFKDHNAMVRGYCMFLLNSLGNHDVAQALAQVSSTLKLEGESGYIFAYFLADSYEKCKRIPQTFYWFLRARELEPRRGEALYRLISLCREHGLSNTASDLLKVSVHIDADHGTSFMEPRYAIYALPLEITYDKVELLKQVDWVMHQRSSKDIQFYRNLIVRHSSPIEFQEVLTLPPQLQESEYRPP